LDYTIDYAKGSVQFTEPLPQGEVAEIQYRYDRALAKPNPNVTRLPLQLNVWQRSGGSLQLIGLMPTHPNAPGGAPVVGVAAETQRSSGKFSSLFLVNAANDAQTGDTGDRSAMRFGGSTGAGGLKLSGNYAEAGNQFAGAPDPKLAAGLRQYDLNLGYDPSKRVSFSSRVERVDATTDARRAQERAVEAHRLAVMPTDRSKLTLSHEVQEKTRADGLREEATLSRAHLEQKLGQKTAATALLERAEAKGATSSQVDRTALTLTTSPSERAKLTGSYLHRDAGEAGEDTTTALALSTTPIDRLKLNSQFSRRTSEREGALNLFGVDWSARATSRVSLDGGFTRRDAELTGTDDAQRLRLSLGAVSLEGQRRERDALAGPDELEETVRLEAGLLRGLRLGGAVGNRVAGEAQAETDLSEAFVELTPDPAFRFRGSVQSAVTGSQEARTTALSATVKAPGLLEITGGYKARETEEAAALISRDYVLAFKPLRGLTLQGAYRENPEDKNGLVLDQVHTSLGLQSQLGSLGLSGTYTAIDSGPASRGAEQFELTLTLGLAPQTRLYSGYRERETRDTSLFRDRTFSLGFTRSVGRSLFLLMEGQYTLSDRDSSSLEDAADTRANARVGVRF